MHARRCHKHQTRTPWSSNKQKNHRHSDIDGEVVLVWATHCQLLSELAIYVRIMYPKKCVIWESGTSPRPGRLVPDARFAAAGYDTIPLWLDVLASSSGWPLFCSRSCRAQKSVRAERCRPIGGRRLPRRGKARHTAARSLVVYA
jgi:hypothetical protein